VRSVFASDFPSLRFFQLANDLKYELKVDISPDVSIACASFNYHERFSGRVSRSVPVTESRPIPGARHSGSSGFCMRVFASMALSVPWSL